jgi:hypothetical protein
VAGKPFIVAPDAFAAFVLELGRRQLYRWVLWQTPAFISAMARHLRAPMPHSSAPFSI